MLHHVHRSTISSISAGAAGAPAAPPASGDAGGATSSTSANDNEPPVIHINGNNPATVTVGDTYADLGATIAGPTADLNLGISTLLDGATTTELTLDTTTPGQHTIEYRVFDQSGLMGSAVRMVDVVAANDNPPLRSRRPREPTSHPPPSSVTQRRPFFRYPRQGSIDY
jgi:hypothetical protein